TGVTAVVLNVTAVFPTAATHLSLWPTGAAQPVVSNVKAPAGTTVPNLVVVRVGADGKVNLFNNSGAVDVVVDVAGYFADPMTASIGEGPYRSLDPARIVDTRDGTGGPKAKLGAGSTRSVTVTGVGGVPATGVTAVVLNVTAVFPTQASHLSLWPSGTTRPVVSNLNVVPGVTVPNLVVVRVGADGKVNLFNNSGAVDVVIDVAGYIAG
ncbi:MAG: hypothetical protein KDB36_04105, partial [Acidimicrobiales bacterium]|nr:hypothetical protein [Acidimicrobiales bacterium]